MFLLGSLLFLGGYSGLYVSIYRLGNDQRTIKGIIMGENGGKPIKLDKQPGANPVASAIGGATKGPGGAGAGASAAAGGAAGTVIAPGTPLGGWLAQGAGTVTNGVIGAYEDVKKFAWPFG